VKKVRQSERLALRNHEIGSWPGLEISNTTHKLSEPVRNVVYLQGLKGMLTLSKFLLSLQFKEGLESYERNILLSPY
jgi:hypothetical protein